MEQAISQSAKILLEQFKIIYEQIGGDQLADTAADKEADTETPTLVAVKSKKKKK